MQRTFLYEKHEAWGGKLVDFGGFCLPVQYKSAVAEHTQCRTRAALFDTSHMGQILATGPSAADDLARVCTQDARKLRIGRCKYGFLLNESGGVIDDTILMRLAEDEFLLIVNAGGRETDFDWIVEKIGETETRLVNLAVEGMAKVDLQGPDSLHVLGPLCDFDLSAMRYFDVCRATVDRQECVLARTGYTGELGYEIMADVNSLLGIVDAIISHEAVEPAGLGARDSLRLEMAYPLYGHELTEKTTPIDAGLEMFVDVHGPFVGAETLRQQQESGSQRRLVFFKADTRRRAPADAAVLFDEEPVGHVTSGAFSPSLATSIGAAYVRADLATVGTTLQVDAGRTVIDVVVSEKPLYTKGTARLKTNS